MTAARAPIPKSELDRLLTAQLALAWAGETGEEPRLGWWRSDLTSEFGGEDFFQRLLPRTWKWATLQAAREAARRRDAELRAQDHNPDRLITLYHLGYELDERLDERLNELKASGQDPGDALPGLKDVVTKEWVPDRVAEWLGAGGDVQPVTAPVGRRLKGEPPASLELLAGQLLAACLPLTDSYPLPHYRRAQ